MMYTMLILMTFKNVLLPSHYYFCKNTEERSTFLPNIQWQGHSTGL